MGRICRFIVHPRFSSQFASRSRAAAPTAINARPTSARSVICRLSGTSLADVATKQTGSAPARRRVQHVTAVAILRRGVTGVLGAQRRKPRSVPLSSRWGRCQCALPFPCVPPPCTGTHQRRPQTGGGRTMPESKMSCKLRQSNQLMLKQVVNQN